MAAMRKRFICVYLPWWPTDLAARRLKSKGLRAESTILLFHKDGGQIVVPRFSPNAKRAGVKSGMSLALAKAVAPDAISLPFRPTEDFKALRRLAQAALKFTPLAAPDQEAAKAFKSDTLSELSSIFYGLVLDITGTERLYRGEEQLAAVILSKLTRARIHARIGAGPTIGAAWALSRFGTQSFNCAPDGDLKMLMRNFPVEALRLPPETSAALRQVGIETLGELFRLPSETLLARFGRIVGARLDELLGLVPEALDLVRAPQNFFSRRAFETPLDNTEKVKMIVLQLLNDVMRKLEAQKKQARAFVIELESLRHDYTVARFAREISLSAATKSFAHLSSVVAPLLETLPLPAGVQAVQITAKNLSHESACQQDLTGREGLVNAGQVLAELFDHLLVRLGPERIRRMQEGNAHLPENSIVTVPIEGGPARLKNEPPPLGGISHRLSGEQQKDCEKYHLASNSRPPRLLERPQPIQAIAMLPDHAPAWIKMKGEKLRILEGCGPERISLEWWRDKTCDERDYFKVQDEHGRWLWIFRDNGSQEWFLHGTWS